MAAATSLMLWKVIVIICSLQPTVSSAPTFSGVKTNIKTTTEDREVETFLGIRYAKAPTGDRRFKLPELNIYLEGDVAANNTPPACIQETRPGSHVSTVGTDEDCLFLNIWKPTCDKPERGFEVLVWIHGGGLQKDTSSNPLYNGANLAAEQCIIVVSVNYRLGVFGFMYLNEKDAPGNMGLQDVAIALEWLHIHLTYFEGDKDAVTLAGNWAGAYIASTLLMTNDTRKYYKRVILQSGAPTTPGFHQNRLTARRLAALLAARLGCLRFTNTHVAECLRKVNANRLQNAYVRLVRETRTTMVSVTDGKFLLMDPIKYLSSGDMQACDILVGHNADEGAHILQTASPQLYTSLLHEPATTSEKVLHALLNVVIRKYSKSRLFSSILPALNAVHLLTYVPTKPPRRLQIMSNISRELVLGCPISLLANKYDKMSRKVYVYLFNYTANTTDPSGWFGATYRSEIPFVFKSSDKQNEPAKFTDKETQLSKNIQDAWGLFVKNRTLPTTVDTTNAWPQYKRDSPELTEFTREAKIAIHSLDTSLCDYWNGNPLSAWNQELFQRGVSKYKDVFEDRTYIL